jgi:sigma-E factor negative regulatory protein RseC
MANQLQHRGVVERIEADTIYVSVVPESACAGCHAKGICGERGEKREIVVKTRYAAEYAVGERVVVATKMPMGLMAVFYSYVLPAIVLVATLAAVVGLGGSEEVAAIASLAAVALYYTALWIARERISRKISFTIHKEQ